MPQPIVQVDAFADRPFAGNPAAVCVLDAPREPGWMQSVATEMNLSETAFLERQDDGGYALRWFTPACEVDLCGHATLASAHVLWQDGHLAPDAEARFQTRSGLLTARRDGEWIWLDFPALPPTLLAEPPAGWAEALDAAPVAVGRSRFDYIVELDSEDVVRALRPDLRAVKAMGARGVIVTARGAAGEFDFVSRFFAPGAGVDEDPVTGSAHCVLTPYWAEKLGKTEMTAYQASARGGVVRVRLAGDRVHLGGQAVTVLRGELVD